MLAPFCQKPVYADTDVYHVMLMGGTHHSAPFFYGATGLHRNVWRASEVETYFCTNWVQVWDVDCSNGVHVAVWNDSVHHRVLQDLL